jgi:hypothetical protein
MTASSFVPLLLKVRSIEVETGGSSKVGKELKKLYDSASSTKVRSGNGRLGGRIMSNHELENEPVLHDQAVHLIQRCTLDFQTALLRQTKVLALRKGDDMILRSHVAEAWHLIKQRERQKRWQTWITVFGGVFFGTGARGFITELQATPDPLRVTFWTVIAMVGLLFVMGFNDK